MIKCRLMSILTIIVLMASTAFVRSQSPSPEAQYRFLFDYDQALPLNVDLKLDIKITGGQYYKLTYQSLHGELIPAILLIPKLEAGEKAPCVILMHGLGSRKEDLIPLWFPLLAQGYAVFSIDAPYHGEREPKDKNFRQVFRYPVRTREMFIHTVIDLRRGVDYLIQRPDIDPTRIGYVGFSMGAITGAVFAGIDTRIKAPVLVVGGGNWASIAKGSEVNHEPPVLKNDPTHLAELASTLAPVDPILWIGQISPRSVLMINGNSDRVIPKEAAKALHAAAKEPKEVLWYKGGHLPLSEKGVWVIVKICFWLSQNL